MTKVANTRNLRRFRVLGWMVGAPEASCERCLVLVQAHEERLCWPRCQIWRYFFQGLDDLFKIMFWSTHLTVGHQEDPMGTLGFKE